MLWWVLSLAACRCLWSVSVEMYLAKMSAGFSLVLTSLSLTMTREINCCMKRCFRSTCFAFLDDPIPVATLLPLDESVWILMLAFSTLRSSMGRLRKCSGSAAPALIA